MIRRRPRRCAVRINDGRTDRHVTAYVTSLRYKKTSPMGFHSAQITLNIDPREFTDLGAGDKIYVYSPTGRVRWEGFIDNPGRRDSDGGKLLEITAMGTGMITSDQARGLVYIDQSLADWSQYKGNAASGVSAPSSSAGTSDDPTGSGVQGLLCQLNPGQPIGTNTVAQVEYFTIARAGMEWGACRVITRSGKADAGYNVEMVYSGPSIAAGWIALQTALVTSASAANRYTGAGAGNPPDGTDAIRFRLKRTAGVGNVPDDNTWTFFANITMLGRRMTRDGVLVSGTAGMVTNLYVRADWVVEDLVGRMLATLVDPYAVTIDETGWQIDQFAFADGASMRQVLDALAVFEPDFLWEVLESTPRGYRFGYRAWPTEARYEISTRDGYDAPGSDYDLCNRVTVRWTDETGTSRVTIRTASAAQYPALSSLEEQGRVKDAETITLPEGKGSLANAQRAGDLVLADKANPPKSATAVVTRPILDLLTGAWVDPCDIEAGHLVRVRELGDVLRLTEVDVDAIANTAQLQLGTPVLTEEQRFVKLAEVTKAA